LGDHLIGHRHDEMGIAQEEKHEGLCLDDEVRYLVVSGWDTGSRVLQAISYDSFVPKEKAVQLEILLVAHFSLTFFYEWYSATLLRILLITECNIMSSP
jgi:uncharacterized membrane protein YwzB